MTYIDSDGQRWELAERARFGREGTQIYQSVAVMVRRAGEPAGCIVSAPAAWQTEAEMARLVFEAKDTGRRVR